MTGACGKPDGHHYGKWGGEECHKRAEFRALWTQYGGRRRRRRYWVTVRQSKPVPLALAHTAWVSCTVANGPTRTL